MTLLAHAYDPRGVCLEVFARRDAEILVSGPAGTGKSRACLEKLHAMAIRNPGMRGLMVRKTGTSLTSSALVTWRRDVIPESERAQIVTFYGGSQAEPAQYRYANGSSIVLGGMDKASKVMSTEYDVIYVQEATELTEDDWESLTSRLRSGVVSFQQIIADCNPAQDTHWLKARCDRGQTLMLRSTHHDNPLLWDDGWTEFGETYINRLKALTGIRRARLYKGEWSSAEGVVYEEWNTATHVIEPFDIPAGWPRYLSVDFGYTNPFVAQWWAEDPDGRLYLYREIYRTKRLVEDHAALIAEYEVPKTIVCDHDAEGRAQLSKRLGRRTIPARKAVQEGIQAVADRLRDAGDGKPRLFIFADAVLERDPELVEAARPTCTADEVPGYIWDQKPDKPPKEEPVKEDDHGMDAMRYMVMHRESRRTSMKGVDLTTGLGRR